MTALLDRILGRVTMYALVIICLVMLAIIALVLSVFGQLPGITPLEILTSASVLLVVSCLANGLGGLLFRTRPQLSSTAITALLLLFILSPTVDLAGLGGLALAAFIAVLGKYVLAVRGRHLFNPAALGAFVVVLTGLTFSRWWIGTPAMLPFVIVGGAAILWRTRRIPLALVFIVVATLMNGLVYTVFGETFLSGSTIALLSSPVVFLACFMLDEPLTLPPRRWQQILEAAVVGVIFFVPFSFGNFASTPEFALIVGNLLAFFFGQRRGIRLTFIGRTQLTPTSWRFDFGPRTPVKFVPGQYMELTLPHTQTDARGWRRNFSIATAPHPDGLISFGMRVPQQSSSFKRAILALEPGTVVSATSVSGDFILPKDAAKPLLLVAAGIGITPFVSQLEHLTATGDTRDIVLLYSIGAPDDLAFETTLRSSRCRVVVVSPTRPSELPVGWSWTEAGEGALTSEMIRDAVPDAASRTTYLSGPPELVSNLEKALHRDGVRRIVTDVFIGY